MSEHSSFQSEHISDRKRKQETAASEVLSLWQDQGQPEQIEMGYATDNYEAQSLGWPSAGAQMATYARIWEMIHGECDIILSPKGSTIGTAAAEDAHNKLL